VTIFDPSLGKYASLIINLIQFGSVILGLVYIQHIIGKRQMFLISISTLSLINFAIAVTMTYIQINALMILMSIFMLIYGAAFLNPVWAYPS
jgi:ABC-type multidrug transport system permease subunit